MWHPLLVARQAALTDIARDDRIAAQLRVAGPDVARIAAARSGTLSSVVTDRAAKAGLTIARIEPQGPMSPSASTASVSTRWSTGSPRSTATPG